VEVLTAIFCRSPTKSLNLDLGVGPSVVVFWRLITPKVQKQGAEELPVDKASVLKCAIFPSSFSIFGKIVIIGAIPKFKIGCEKHKFVDKICQTYLKVC
jgi:hypothetical protein